MVNVHEQQRSSENNVKICSFSSKGGAINVFAALSRLSGCFENPYSLAPQRRPKILFLEEYLAAKYFSVECMRLVDYANLL